MITFKQSELKQYISDTSVSSCDIICEERYNHYLSPVYIHTDHMPVQCRDQLILSCLAFVLSYAFVNASPESEFIVKREEIARLMRCSKDYVSKIAKSIANVSVSFAMDDDGLFRGRGYVISFDK